MATAEQLRVQAQAMDRGSLLELWERVKGRSVPVGEWPAGGAFEHLVVRAFELEGAEVRWPYQVTYPQKFGAVEQIDGVVRLDGMAFLLESKDLDEAASIEALAKLRFRLEARPPGTMGVLFSANDFTLATEVFAQFASPLNVLLWGRTDLDLALPCGLMVEGLRAKLKYAVEDGLPLLPLGETS